MITATLAGRTATHARVTIPAWGASYADVSLDGEITLSGKVALVVADFTMQCTVLSGGPAIGRSFYRIVAGAGGWGRSIPAKSYANDAGVKLSTVLSDAASAVGETLDASTIPATTLGPAFTRPADQACRVLEMVAPQAWYIGEDGKTRLGQRPSTTLGTEASVVSQIDLARGVATIASDTIAKILPGLTVYGLKAVDVEHEMSPDSGLRTTIWGAQGGNNSRRLAAFAAIFAQLDPNRKFQVTSEYRVVSQEDERLNLQPVRVSTGMPDLQRVPVRPGLPGCKAMHSPGSRVLVGFVNAEPGRPVVLSFDDAEASGFVPPTLGLAGGGQPIGRIGDQVQVFLPPTLVVVGTVAGDASGPVVGTIATASPINGLIVGGSPGVTSG